MNSILFQRGINSADLLVPAQQHGLTILMSEEEIKDFFEKYSLANLKMRISDGFVHLCLLDLCSVY